MTDLILQTLHPATHDLGGFKVHRTLPHRERTTIGPFIFVDEFGPARLPAGRGMDVRPHPHINLATVTYLFAGAIDHRDSLGTFATIGLLIAGQLAMGVLIDYMGLFGLDKIPLSAARIAGLLLLAGGALLVLKR